MEKYTYPEIIKNLLEEKGDWLLGNELNNLQTPWGFLPPRGQRTARSMANKGIIDKDYFEKNGRRLVYYRLKLKTAFRYIQDPQDREKMIEVLA